jgi:hypothetical protein
MATTKKIATQTKKTTKPKAQPPAQASPAPAAAVPAVIAATPVQPAPTPSATPKVASSLPALIAGSGTGSGSGTTSLITTTANGSNHGTKVDLQATYQALMFGLMTYYEPTDVFTLQSGDMTRDELVADIQQFVTACQATKTSNQEWRGNVQTERTLEQQVKVLRQGIKGIVQARFGASGTQCLQFGFTLPKPKAKTATTKAVAVQKALATRKQRGTMGKKEKAAIHGNVSVALVVTPSGAGTGGATAPTSAGSASPQVATAPAAALAVVPAVAPAVANGAPVVAAPAGGTSSGH